MAATKLTVTNDKWTLLDTCIEGHSSRYAIVVIVRRFSGHECGRDHLPGKFT